MFGANQEELARSKQALLRKQAEALRELEAKRGDIALEWNHELEGIRSGSTCEG